jgi:ABC-type cobalt transport system substrate-binding protein
MPVITLGSRSFAGPFLAPLWSPPKSAGVYAVMAPGWRLLTFRALEFAQAGDLADPRLLKQHAKYREWITIVGTEWNLYIATHELSFSTDAQRAAVVRELARDYRPEFKPITPPDAPSLKTLLLAQAMRTNKDN